MTARPRAAKTTTLDAATFDADAWVRGFHPPVVRVPLFKRADLIPRITELQEAAEAAKPNDDDEGGVTDGAQYVEMVNECNALIEQLTASAEWFEFGPGTKPKMDAAKAAADADGVAADDLESRAVYEMAETLISPRVPGKALVALRDTVGDPAFNSLYGGWLKALALSKAVDAPFSPLPLPTPDIGD